jgi:hypothetical protein
MKIVASSIVICRTAGRRKASFTHLIAFAILRALEQFPQMNDGFEVVDVSRRASSARRSIWELPSIWKRKTERDRCWFRTSRTRAR